MRSNNTSNVSGGVGLVHVDYASHIPGDTAGNYWGSGIFSSSSNHWFNGDPVTAGESCSWFLVLMFALIMLKELQKMVLVWFWN